MPQSWYFLTGDLVANCTTAMIVALCCYSMIDSSWPMLIAMLTSMILGMILSMIIALLLFMRFFGAMEVMLPVMLSGMWAGMIVGMRAAMAPLSLMDSCLYGLLTGLAVIALCWAANSRLQGKWHHE